MNLAEVDLFVGAAEGLLPWMNDVQVTDILINGKDSLYVERAGQLLEKKNPFQTNGLAVFVERLLLTVGRAYDVKRPFLDGRLSNGLRFHVLFPPVAPQGPFVSLRKPYRGQVELAQFAAPEMLTWLLEDFLQRKNLLISGGTGSGKTTLLRGLLAKLPATERVLLLEESRELPIERPNHLVLESRSPGPDTEEGVPLSILVRQALRMRPDRIVIGECRGVEALDLLQAMNTGHRGSVTTLHANNAREALRRLETLAAMGAPNLPLQVIREWIGSNVNRVVHLAKTDQGRKIIETLEVNGLEGPNFRLFPGPGLGAWDRGNNS